MKMKKLLIPLLATLAVACGSDPSTPTLEESPFLDCSPDPNPDLSATGTDAAFLQIANRQLGFAGLLIRDDAVEVSVARGHEIDVDAYRTAITNVFGSLIFEGNGTPRPLRFRTVAFTWQELLLARNAYWSCLFGAAGVVSIDVSEDDNRVVVGVLNQATRAHVLDFVSPDGDKFLVEIEGPFIPDTD